MIRRFASARLFPQSAGAKQRTIQVQAIKASAGWHHGKSVATDFFAESVKSQAIRDYAFPQTWLGKSGPDGAVRAESELHLDNECL
jgi:hypothetical protein